LFDHGDIGSGNAGQMSTVGKVQRQWFDGLQFWRHLNIDKATGLRLLIARQQDASELALVITELTLVQLMFAAVSRLRQVGLLPLLDVIFPGGGIVS
jgi:hypothetical protein